MASSMIHIVVASEINKKINRDRSKLLIGTIAPDISKLIGQSRIGSHFSDISKPDIPILDKFLSKYKDKLYDDFVLGYFIHLYVDYLWFKYFITEIYDEDAIKKLDGSIVKCDDKTLLKYIYNDYTNLNIQLIDEYNLDLKIFYNEIPKLDNIIEEIPMDKINIIVNKAGNIIENTEVHKEMVFDINNIKRFIKTCVDIIYSEIIKLGVKDENN